MAGYNDPERGRAIGRARGDLERLLKEMQVGSEERRQTSVNAVNRRGQDVAESGALARAAMQYGIGGSADRGETASTARTAMNYGPGGSEDRQREILKPYYGAMGQHNIAAAENLAADTRISNENWSLFDKPRRAIQASQFAQTAPAELTNTMARLGFTTRGFDADKPEIPVTPGLGPVNTTPMPKQIPWYLQGAQNEFAPRLGEYDINPDVESITDRMSKFNRVRRNPLGGYPFAR